MAVEAIASGTTTKVAGPVKYPGFGTVLQHLAWHLRGSFLAALFCVYITCDQSFGLPALLRYVHSSSAIQTLLTTSEPAKWMNSKVFDGRSDGKTLQDALLFSFITSVVHVVMYTCMNGTFALFDVTGLFSRYKLPRTPRMKLSKGLVAATLKEAAPNQLITGPIVLFLLYVYASHFRSMFITPGAADMVPRPAVTTVWYHMAMASLINEFFFYWAHRAFHEVPGMYVRFHKQHHKYVGPIGISAEYAHPLEQALANQIPTALYIIVASATVDQSIWFTWIAWRLWETYEAHGSYCFTGSWLSQIGLTYGERAQHHDWHHSDNRGNYGVFWLDYLFGTMDSYAQLLADGGHEGRARKAKGKAE